MYAVKICILGKNTLQKNVLYVFSLEFKSYAVLALAKNISMKDTWFTTSSLLYSSGVSHSK